MPTVPFHPASSHVCLGTTWVAVDCGGSTSAGAMRRTITVWPTTSLIMHPMNSVGNERYWRVRKRRAWAERLSVRAALALIALGAEADCANRTDSGCKASSVIRPAVAKTTRPVRVSNQTLTRCMPPSFGHGASRDNWTGCTAPSFPCKRKTDAMVPAPLMRARTSPYVRNGCGSRLHVTVVTPHHCGLKKGQAFRETGCEGGHASRRCLGAPRYRPVLEASNFPHTNPLLGAAPRRVARDQREVA